MNAQSCIKKVFIQNKKQKNKPKNLSGEFNTKNYIWLILELGSWPKKHFVWFQRCFGVILTGWKMDTYSHLMASTCVEPSRARQASSPPAIPMTTSTSTSKTPSAPNWTTRLAHFTWPQLTAPPSPMSLSDWRQRLSRVGSRSRRLQTAQIGPNPGPGLTRVILGPPLLADSSRCMTGILIC